MTAVVFKGINTLNFQEVRMNVVRVPEVLSSIQKAQRIWDENSERYVNLLNYITSDDSVFLADPKLKNLCRSIIKIGLYHRYLRKSKFPKYLIGDVSDDSALLNCVGQLSFEKLVKEHVTQDSLRLVKNSDADMVTLTGDALEDWACYEFNEKKARFEEKELSTYNLEGVLETLQENKKLKKVVNMGPDTLTHDLKKQLKETGLEFVEAIDNDPGLNWFWPSMQPLNESVVAN